MALDLPTPIVSTDWLAAHLGDPSLRVVDATWHMPATGRKARDEYAAAHLPGAVFADIDALSDETAPYPHTLPSPEIFAARVGALGLGSEHAIVVYDSSAQNFSAPRVWYMLRTMGHARVAILDGGLAKWKAEGRALSGDAVALPPATFTPSLDAARWRDLAAMEANAASHAEQVVDARSPGRFQATEPEPRAGVRGGHIPGARNVHYATLVNADGTLKSVEALRAQFASAGLDLSAPIVASCGSGITACAVTLGLEVAGAQQVAVYDGSWTEWGSQTSTPVETGPARER
jgi:thiosulfate/3-mercaptopyruvate sulfurtransferase